MPGETTRRGALNRICGWIFIAGIAMLALEVLAYVLGARTSGVVFASGMAVVLVSALIGAAVDRCKPKAEDLVTIAVGAGFFIWLAWKALS